MTYNYSSWLSGADRCGYDYWNLSIIADENRERREREERYGLDMAEVGLEAYPDFEIRRAG